MRCVWKFPLTLGAVTLEMPPEAEALHVEAIDDQPYLWALVDTCPPEEYVARRISIFGTGHEVPAGWTFLGSFTIYDGRFIGHVFAGPGEIKQRGWFR